MWYTATVKNTYCFKNIKTMHTRIISATTVGVQAHRVDVEVDLSFGMLQFNIVGLPDASIKESRQRVATALKNCGLKLPERKITVNLAPADLKKEGTLFDLPIALGILQCAEQLSIPRQFLDETVILGELSLAGEIKRVRGVLPIAYYAKQQGIKRIVVPLENAQEAALIDGLEVIGVSYLVDLLAHLRAEKLITPTPKPSLQAMPVEPLLDFSDVAGQQQAKRALQIAAAGKHNILFFGTPGSGKTMLAKRLSSIMPPLSFEEMLAISMVYSVTGKLGNRPLITERPLRAPHHTISPAGLVGGGSNPQPGEISLAHHGILFLDELVEFKRSTLEVLRQPLESHEVCISRATQSTTFPSSFLLVAALNPCPCGYRGDPRKECTCSPLHIKHYLEKLSGPLIDRIDLQIPIQPVAYESIMQPSGTHTSSQQLYVKVERAVARQRSRFNSSTQWNSSMTPNEVKTYCTLTSAAEETVKLAFDKLGLSMRGYHKLLKVARTIADLEDSDQIDRVHVQEAVMYRSLEQALDRQGVALDPQGQRS